MNYLLDTHSIIWFSQNNPKLSKKAKRIISNSENTCFISLATIWEMSIKLKLNKLFLENTLIEFVDELIKRDFILMNIQVEHVITAGSLDLIHNDPFDRLLISQSYLENIPIISKDMVFDNYGVLRIW